MDWKRVFNPPFIAAAALLLAALVGLQSVVQGFQLFLMKQRIELRQPLYLIPEKFGSYQKVHEEKPSKDILDELGTRDTISWTFRDTERAEGSAGSMVRLHVAYYTGTPDTAPHVPEVCYVAGGATHGEIEHRSIRLDSPSYYTERDAWWAVDAVGQIVRVPSREVPVRVFEYTPRESAGGRATLIYFFMSNGTLLSKPDEVRARVLDLRSKYAYWCKVQVEPVGVSDRDESLAMATRFTAAVMPQLLACLPDWHEVLEGRYPR